MAEDNAGGPLNFVVRRARGVLGIMDEAATTVIRAVAGAVLDRIDLDDLVSRVDVNLIAERVDVRRVADRVDVEGIADRVDVNRIADRVDVDRVADRVDVDAVIVRIDLVGLTGGVLAEIDLGRIVRDTGGGMAAETADAIRLLGRRGDRGVNRFSDRLLGRAGPPQGQGDGPPPGRAR
ncbi:hypothetical protein GCM10009837_40180 [Streptomyces durmitorensis]|uniref:Asp23/Gls24 family envelope stress response protein n=1 Tax=Streptomyces durmitorensis TaxID=319947 RepID=A0ABY4Q6D7_9ACTN|nr:hypothetical protein [Streptomyces durmitorensis]UQT60934.1 hypothetical protein M4V62_40930 [Streptomyces durmitorensis]